MQKVADASIAVWDSLATDYHYSLSHYRSTIIDTADEAWAILRLARFGKLDQVKPHHYGPVNAEFRDMYREAYDLDSNLIMLHKAKAEYVNDQRTGKRERAGFSENLLQIQYVDRGKLGMLQRNPGGSHNLGSDGRPYILW